MAAGGRPTFGKRQREADRDRKKRSKAERLARRRSTRDDPPAAPGEDPDIAGIVPGPQPLPWDDED
jgi:hypothetical protein